MFPALPLSCTGTQSLRHMLEPFERQVAAGREALAAGHPGEAAAELRAPVELWRGPPLAELGYFGSQPQQASLNLTIFRM